MALSNPISASSRPRTAHAAILVELRKPLALAQVELPQVLAAGQVLVRVHFSGICGSQIGEISGVKGEDRFLPHLLGHEGSGTVIDVGPGVRNVSVGNTVVLHWRKGAGIEAEPASYRWNDRKVNAGWVTTFNDYAVVSENRVTRIQDDSDLKVAALFGCAVTTGFGVARRDAQIGIGDAVVVYGSGGIGLNIVQAASMVSAYPIIAVDLHANRLELAKRFGATHLIHAGQVDPFKSIASLLPRGADVFIDNTGVPAVIQAGYDLTGAKGRVVLVGVPVKGNNISLYSLPLHFGKTLVGSHGGGAVPQDDIPRYMDMFRGGRLSLSDLITDVFDLEDVNSAIDALRSGNVAGRCLIRMG